MIQGDDMEYYGIGKFAELIFTGTALSLSGLKKRTAKEP
jgi:hypothetical protein